MTVFRTSLVTGGLLTEAIKAPWQRKVVYASGRFWAFYSDGANMVYETSTDGINWAAAIVIRAADRGCRFSVWFDGTNFAYAYNSATYLGGDDGTIYFRMGTLNLGGTISWLAVEQTVVAGVRYTSVFVIFDSNGYPWINYVATLNLYVLKSSTNNGTWTNAVGFPIQVNVAVAEPWSSILLPLTAGKVSVIYGAGNQCAFHRLYNGVNFDPEESIGDIYFGGYSSDELPFSAVTFGDDVYLVGMDGATYEHRFLKRTYGVGWGPYTVLWTYGIFVLSKYSSSIYAFRNYGAALSLRIFTAGTWTTTETIYTSTNSLLTLTSSYDAPALIWRDLGTGGIEFGQIIVGKPKGTIAIHAKLVGII